MNKIKRIQAETPNIVQGRDLFQTPNYATELLIPFIPKNIKYVWEVAAGDGKISRILTKHGYGVLSFDLQVSDSIEIICHNFLGNLHSCSKLYPKDETAIITNPPFSLKYKFYKRCLEIGNPFALLIPADYSGWLIDAVDKHNCEKLIPTRRINYITPTGKSEKTGNISNFHSLWLTWGFNLGKTETFVELSLNERKNNI